MNILEEIAEMNHLNFKEGMPWSAAKIRRKQKELVAPIRYENIETRVHPSTLPQGLSFMRFDVGTQPRGRKFYWSNIGSLKPDRTMDNLFGNPSRFINRLAGWAPNLYPTVEGMI